MITLESALRIFKKYGYNSKTVSPFLYKKNKDIGVCYSYIDDKYGITERIALFNNEYDLDNFFKKFQWYKLNGKQKNVSLKLNNYEIANPDVLYIRDNHVMTDEEMFNMDNYDKKQEKNKKLSHTKRLLVEADNLMERYYLEKEKISKYTNNLYSKERELRRYYLELQSLVDKYNHVDNSFQTSEDVKEIEFDVKQESELNGSLVAYHKKIPKEDILYSFIIKIWNLNKGLELNKDYMYALKVNDDIDEEMRIVVTKIDYMKEVLQKKKSIFRMISLKDKFDSIEKQSTYTSIYDSDFEKKYKEFIEKKYDVITKINEFRLTEYLNNFKTNKEYDIERNVERCRFSKDVKVEGYNSDTDDIYKSLEKQFISNLNSDERAALILYTSIYHELFDMIMNVDDYENIEISKLMGLLNITDGFKKILDDCYQKVKNFIVLDENLDIRKSVFKNVNFDSDEKFVDSIKKNIIIISNINEKMTLKKNTRLYFAVNSLDDLDKDHFIVTSAIISPYLIKKNNDYSVLSCNVKKGIAVLFAPHTISIPADNAYSKVIELNYDKTPEIILDTKDLIFNKDKNTIIYSKFKSNNVTKDDYVYVDNFEEKFKVNINKVLIEKRKKNEK